MAQENKKIKDAMIQSTTIPSDDGFGMCDVGEAKPSKYKVEEGQNENEVIIE